MNCESEWDCKKTYDCLRFQQGYQTGYVLRADNSGIGFSWVSPIASSFTFGNGITLTGLNVTLGGALTQPTTINTSAINTLEISVGTSTGQKALKITGDLQVTGVIDPIELLFSGNTINGGGYRISALQDNPIYISPFVDRIDALSFRKADNTTVIASIDTINSKFITDKFQMTNGAGTNKILQSDALGNASWVTATLCTLS